MNDQVYMETFEDGPGGWYGWISNAVGPKPLEHQSGRITSRSPWWIDYNHAPPGAGYIHMVFCLNTFGPQAELFKEIGGPNRFTQGQYPTDFRESRLTVRLRGEVLNRGAELVLLVQGNIDGIVSGWLCTADPFSVGEQSSSQTITLEPDPTKWTPLGGRHDRLDMYGVRPLSDVLGKVNLNIMLVLFPLDISPMGPLDGDLHILRPERDYPVWRHRLPEGYVTLDEMRIDFA